MSQPLLKTVVPVAVSHTSSFSIWLDLFRWMAAFAVLLAHVRHRIFEDPTDPSVAKPLAYLATQAVSSFGAAAVIIFFVLSGFLVGGGSLRRYLKEGTFDVADYMISRLSRLWTVLIPVFLITLIINKIGIFYIEPLGADVYSSPRTEGVGTFACNIVFLQTAFCNQFGDNGALWSLFNEFWYYCAWPFITVALWSPARSKTSRALLVAIALGGLGLLAYFQFVGPNVLVYFSLWLLGVVAAVREKPFVRVPQIVAFGLFGASLLIWRVFALREVQGSNLLVEYPLDLLIALAFTNLVLILKSRQDIWRPPFPTLHKKLADFSFTLYCLHTPVLHFIGAVFLWAFGRGWHLFPTKPTDYLFFIVATIGAILSAYLLSHYTEQNTGKIRRYWGRMLGTRPVAAKT